MCLCCAVRDHSLCVVVLSRCWHPDRLCCCNISRGIDRVLCSLCRSSCPLSFFYCFSLFSLISPQQGPNTCMSNYKRLWASEHGLCWRLVYSQNTTKGRFRDSKHCCAWRDVHDADDRSDSSGFQASRRLSTLSVPVGSQTVFFKFSTCMLDFWVFASTSPRRACKTIWISRNSASSQRFAAVGSQALFLQPACPRLRKWAPRAPPWVRLRRTLQRQSGLPKPMQRRPWVVRIMLEDLGLTASHGFRRFLSRFATVGSWSRHWHG